MAVTRLFHPAENESRTADRPAPGVVVVAADGRSLERSGGLGGIPEDEASIHGERGGEGETHCTRTCRSISR